MSRKRDEKKRRHRQERKALRDQAREKARAAAGAVLAQLQDLAEWELPDPSRSYRMPIMELSRRLIEQAKHVLKMEKIPHKLHEKIERWLPRAEENLEVIEAADRLVSDMRAEERKVHLSTPPRHGKEDALRRLVRMWDGIIASEHLPTPETLAEFERLGASMGVNGNQRWIVNFPHHDNDLLKGHVP